MSLRCRIPTDLAERIRRRATRDGEGSSIAMALRLLAEHVDGDLRAGRPPRRPVATR